MSLIEDEEGYGACEVGNDGSQSKSNQKVKPNMSSSHNVKRHTVKQVFDQVEKILEETWQETGFGKVTIESEREKSNVIRVIVKGSTYYKFFIDDEEVSKWSSRK
ncbi:MULTISPECIES: hypothetical protein [Microcoleus]|uniref:Uncharacterized protein n=1 Tax=Microcoleus anatoxicus PTRS2 TaxID=2705321 RepID=A0ABU8YXM6_9CYAN